MANWVFTVNSKTGGARLMRYGSRKAAREAYGQFKAANGRFGVELIELGKLEKEDPTATVIGARRAHSQASKPALCGTG